MSGHGFDRIAPLYEALERWFAGGCMQRCRLAHVAGVPGPQRVLVLGEGPGRFLESALTLWPDASFTIVEASAGMIARAQKRRPGNAGRVTFLHADALGWAAGPECYDVIVTNFFLDCFPVADLSRLIPKLAAALTPGGHWLLADFAVPARGPARWRARVIVGLLYRFFRLSASLRTRALVNPEPILTGAGLQRLARQEWEWGLLRADLWQKPAAEPVP